MRRQDRPTLVQRWIIVADEDGTEHLEARWVVVGEAHTPAYHAA
jgi:hypothetical protein